MTRFLWRKIRGSVLCAIVLTCPIVSSPSQALAVAIPGFTGYTGDQFGIINYAVLSPFDSFAGILAGAYVPRPGDAAFDASKYTYLYQVASLPALTASGSQVQWLGLEPETRRSLPISATTVGWFASGNLRLDFLNGGAIVNTTGNNLQGTGSLGIAARTVSGAELITVIAPTCCGRGTVNWGFGGLSPGFTSPLVGYQSNFAPSFGSAALNGIFAPSGYDGLIEKSSGGPIPNAYATSATSAPEPGTVLLIGSGLLGVLAWRRTNHVRQL